MLENFGIGSKENKECVPVIQFLLTVSKIQFNLSP